MYTFARLHAPLPRRLSPHRRALCTARLTHQPTPAAFRSKHRFLVLSDLHVKRETLQTCLQALQFAHDEALKRDAAVLFLGDFWHARGNLPVEPLNAILTQLASWEVPLVMIPGNHDLVSRSGTGVSLVPLATTLDDRCLLITSPTVCLDALFLPYMHDVTSLKAALREAAVLPHSLRAVFCHAEVAGARLADRIIAPSSPNSLKPADFPPSTRVYSGHIHRPHVVSETIRYVGSPYQVSASEQGQDKELLVLDRSLGWQVVDSIPIDVGPRHFTVCLDQPHEMPSVRRGDRVTIQTATDASKLINDLRDQGIRVEVQQTISPTASSAGQDGPFAPVEPRISPGALSNNDLFRKYAAIKNLGAKVTSAGLDILQEVGGRVSSVSGKDVLMQWESVTMRGFGTFLEEVSYPLRNRGLVLLTGRDCDEGGALTGRTNATGKTTLVMAALWAMTGRTDARPDGSVEKGVSLEMVHDDSKDCQVTVRLKLGGERAFSEAYDMMTAEERMQAKLLNPAGERGPQFLDMVVTRSSTRNGTVSKTRSYKQSLCLRVNQIDLSCLDLKETQVRIDRLVDGTLLPHTVFFGQHMGAGRGLVDSTDRTLKDHLALIFPLDIWKEARKKGRSKLTKLQELQVTSEASLEAAKAVVTRLEAAETSSRQQMKQFEADRMVKLAAIDQLLIDEISSRSRSEEDSLWFAESFAVSNQSEDLVRIVEASKRFLRTLEEQKDDKLDLARASAAAEMARTKAVLEADGDLHERATALIKKSTEWEETRKMRKIEIDTYVASTRQELARMASSHEIDVSWKEARDGLKRCDERLQELVGINVRHRDSVPVEGFADQLIRVESARKRASVVQEDMVRLQTSLHEIRHRLMQSEEFSLFGQEGFTGEPAAASVATETSLVTCEKCLRPFDGVLYEEARGKLELEAKDLELRIRDSRGKAKEEVTAYEDAIGALNHDIDREKERIIEEKRRIAESLNAIRAKRDTRAVLEAEVEAFISKGERLQADPNLYLEELRTFRLIDDREAWVLPNVVEKLSEVLEERLQHSRRTASDAEDKYNKIEEEIQRREREDRYLAWQKTALRQHIDDLQRLIGECKRLESERESIQGEANPYEESLRMLTDELSREASIVEKRKAEYEDLSTSIGVLKAIDVAFGPRGVPSFILEEGLTWLEKITATYLHKLSAGELMLQIRAFSDYKSSSRVDGENKEVISKRIFVKKQDTSEMRERSLRQLSGGQRRRCSLAFALAFADLAHERAGFQSSLIVLDEILQSLDQDGRVRMSRIIPGLLSQSGGFRDTVIVVAQDEAPEIAGFAHGGIDVVERRSDRSQVFLDGTVTEA